MFFNWANCVSLLRPGLGLLFILLFERQNVLASTLVMSLIMISDSLDGYLARKLKTASPMGGFVDRFADNVVVVSVLLFFTLKQLLHPIVFAIIILRELLILDYRYAAMKTDPSSRANRSTTIVGKTKMALLMTGMLVMIHSPPIAAYVFYAAVVATLVSAGHYLRNAKALYTK